MPSRLLSPTQRGASMIEVLVTVIILTFGLLGLVGLQTKLQASEMEAYQRAQALVILQDMASRLASNRNNAASYVTETALGAGGTCPTISGTSTRQERDASEWCDVLLGAAEKTADESNVGALIGGRGCVENVSSNEYMITVAWQGLGPISAPPSGVACGAGLYDGGADSPCTGNLCRRTVTTIVRIAALI